MNLRSIGARHWKLPLRWQLILAQALILTIFLGFTGISAYYAVRLVQVDEELSHAVQVALVTQEFSRASLALVSNMDESILKHDQERFLTIVPQALQELNQRHTELRSQYPATTGLDFAFARFSGFTKTAINFVEQGQWEVLENSRLIDMGSSIDEMNLETSKIVQATQAEQARVDQEKRDLATVVLRSTVTALVLAVITSFITSSAFIASIARKTKVLVSAVEQLAEGQLDRRVPVDWRDELGQLALAFNQMADHLQSLYDGLEASIADRTAELEKLADQMRTSAEVGQAATTLLDPYELLTRVVRLIADRFGYYHAGIFLLDKSGDYAALQAASSPGGQRMLARGHRLAIGQGVVGAAIQQGQPYVAQNVGRDAAHFQNSDLPDTQAEVALPLRARGRIIGALDVQSTSADAFLSGTVEILQNMADQVALALDNAQLYQEAQERLAEVNRLFGAYNREAWQKTLRSQPDLHYRYTPQDGVTAAGSRLDNGRPEAGHTGTGPTGQPSIEGDPAEALERPIQVRGEVIGRLKVRRSAGRPDWQAEELSLLAAIIDQLGMALESARLYNETRRRAERERLAGEISARMRASNDPQQILQTAVSELRQALQAQQAQILLQPSDHHRHGEEAGT